MAVERAPRTTLRRAVLGGIVGAAALALVPAAHAQQAWPNKPIRWIVGFAPGGGTDIVARALAPKVGEVLGTTIVVENRSGAAGTIGADVVAKSPADGYTFLVGHANSNAIAPNVLSKVPFDPINDFTPVTYIGYVPNVLVVHPTVNARNVEELIGLAKQQPGKLTYASSGVGSTQHLAGALFNKLAGTEMVHVPYKGSGQAIIDLVGGQVNMNFDTMPPVLEHIRAGKIRALAISTPARLPQLPDVPTFEEKNIRGFDVTNWYSIIGPKGLPADMVARMDDAVRKAMNDPKIRQTLDAQGVQFGGPQTPADFSKFIQAELSKYSRLVKELNVSAQ
jgi:tripartite-type tricarboxylate transporter receptor subunit TctC